MERWRAIPGYESRYSVSDCGRVRSEARVVETRKPDGSTYLHPVKERILCAQVQYGYPRVLLCDGQSKRQFGVHRLVLFTFVGPCPDGYEACHKDGNRGNATLENLRWDTHKANVADKLLHGTHQAGAAHPRAKLTPEQVALIRSTIGPARKLSSRLGVSAVHINAIRRGKCWRLPGAA